MTREEAQEFLTKISYTLGNMEVEYLREKDGEKMREAIMVLKQPRWIPVSERLPEDHKNVLIYLSSNQITIGLYNSHRLPFMDKPIGWGANTPHDWSSDEVIAWMPLPEPYKAESEDKRNEKDTTIFCQSDKRY